MTTMPDLLSLLDKSDRLKEVAPELSEYGRDLGDVQLLLRMMTELIPPEGDLSEETIERIFVLWRSACPVLDAAHSELRSIVGAIDRCS